MRDHRTSLPTPHLAASESKSGAVNLARGNTAGVKSASEVPASDGDKEEKKTTKEETGITSSFSHGKNHPSAVQGFLNGWGLSVPLKLSLHLKQRRF